MKRLLALSVGVSLLAGICASSFVGAAPAPDSPGKGKNKQLLCHRSEEPVLDEDGNPVLDDDGNPVTEVVGVVISVSANGNAVEAHEAHGDVKLEDGAFEKGDECTCLFEDTPPCDEPE